jgi:hypothetical protein
MKHLNIKKKYNKSQQINIKHKWVQEVGGFAFFMYQSFTKKFNDQC